MAYYTGIDVSLRSVSICVIDDTGKSLWRRRSKPTSKPS